MSVDVEIYLSQLFKFFNENPNELNTLVPQDQKNEFFKKCREAVMINLNKGDELSLTKKQLIEICVKINNKKIEPKEELFFNAEGLFQKVPLGFICLN